MISRRLVLRTGALATLGCLIGSCTSDGGNARSGAATSAGTPPPETGKVLTADIRLVVAAIAEEEAALTFFTTAASRFPQHRWLRTAASMQRGHVSRMRASLVRLRPPASTKRPHVPRRLDDLTPAVMHLEETLRAARMADCWASASGPLAEIFGSMAASHAATASALMGSKPAGSTVPPPRAVQEATVFAGCLAAEYAAVFGYGLLGGVLAAGVSDSSLAGAARTSYDIHRARRDQLAELFTHAGRKVPAAEPAYRIPFAVTGPGNARRLARLIEQRCGAVYLRAVGETAGDARRYAADVLVDCAQRGVGWGARPTAFPGLPS